MKKTNKFKVLALTLAMTMSMVACGGGKTSTDNNSAQGNQTGNAVAAETAKKDMVVYAYPHDPESFGPLKTPKAGYSEVTWQVYDNLFDTDEKGNFIPGVCTEIEQVDGMHYKLHLRDDVVFSDGHKLVAEDVVYTLKTVYNDAASKVWAKYVDVEKTNAIDDTTVEVVLQSENAFAIVTLRNVNLFYQDAYEASEDHMASNPIGSGPYTLKEYVKGSYALFEAREDYWAGAPEIKNLKIVFIKEGSQRTTALRTGEADCAFDILTSDYDALMAEGFVGLQGMTDKINVIQFNCSEYSICNDAKVRQAIAYATDSEGIFNAAYGGFGSLCTTCASSASVNIDSMYIPEDYYSYNLERAKELLAEAGIAAGTPITIDVKSGNSAQTTAAEILQQSLLEIGLQPTIRQVENAVYDDTHKDHQSGYDLNFDTQNTAGSRSSLDLMNLYCFVIPNLAYTNEEMAQKSAEAVNTTNEELIHTNTLLISEAICNDVPYYAISSNCSLAAVTPKLNEVKFARGTMIRGTEFSWK